MEDEDKVERHCSVDREIFAAPSSVTSLRYTYEASTSRPIGDPCRDCHHQSANFTRVLRKCINDAGGMKSEVAQKLFCDR